jgi:cytidine deaminase
MGTSCFVTSRRRDVAIADTRARLIAAAEAACGEFGLRDGFSAGSVGAALLTARGNVYTGICIELACGLGFCAEVAAVAEMLKHRETEIAAIVAVSDRGILPPCGRCRETIVQVDARNLECRVILAPDRDAILRELLPTHWLAKGDAKQDTAIRRTIASRGARS